MMVKSWIEWTRENVNTTPEYPKITSLAIAGHPWEPDPEHLYGCEKEEVRQERLAAFTDAIAPDVAAFAPRFTALHYYHSLLSEANHLIADPAYAVLWQYYDDADLKSVAAGLQDDLALIVRALPVEQCAAHWPFFRWEILNSYLIRDWNRALKLYNRSEELELLEPSELQVLRGQFRFLAVYFTAIVPREEGLDSLRWEPVIYGLPPKKPNRSVTEAITDLSGGADDKFNSLPPYRQEEALSFVWQSFNARLLFSLGLIEAESESELPDREREWLHDASVDLEKALRKRTDLPSAYRSILARSFFLTDHFNDAAKQYVSLIQTDPSVKDVYESLALSYRRAGESQKAIEALDKCADKFPNEKGILLKKGEIQAQETDVAGLVETLRKELDRNPELEKDWKLSALLAIAETYPGQRTSAYLEKLLDRQPHLSHLMHFLLQTYWPCFLKLADQSQQEWKISILCMHYLPHIEPHFSRLFLDRAAQGFAKVVELELKARVFAEFREHVRRNQNLVAAVDQALMNNNPERLYQYLKDKKHLTLGEMSTVINRCRDSKEPILRDFHQWLHKSNPDLLKKGWLLSEISRHRGSATHQTLDKELAETMPEWCRQVIEALC